MSTSDTMLPEFSLTGPLPVGTVVLEASAGTGKTFTIAALAARYIAEGPLGLDQMMMVTFSKAATVELRSRVLSRLRETRQALIAWLHTGTPPLDPVDQLLCQGELDQVQARLGRLDDALADADAATIATTHEFCARMLDELGLLVDHDATSHFVQDLTELQDQVIRDVYLKEFPQPGPRFAEVQALGKAVLNRGDIPLASAEDNPVSQAQYRVASAIRAEFDRRKRHLGVYTFDDMVSRLRAALTDPVTGPDAAALLAQRFQLVLIDEFQDTDLAQWDIVSRAFVGRSIVVLIGDPKQAIYAFRDADVLAYLNAVGSADAVFTLATNYRSDAAVVNGVAELFHQAALGDPRIAVHPVTADRQSPRLRRRGTDSAPATAVQVRCLSADRSSSAPSPNERSADSPPTVRISRSASKPNIWRLRERVDEDLVAVVAELLDGTWEVADQKQTEQGQSFDDWRPLRASDIAVLVRSNRRAGQLQLKLAAAGIDAVSSGAQSVFAAEAARDWQLLLRALIEPSAGALAQVAMTSLFGWTLDEYAVAATGQGSKSLDQLAVDIRTLQRELYSSGVAAVFASVLDLGAVAARLLASDGGERTFTDLRHLAELLNDAQVRSSLNPPALLRWLDERVSEASAGTDGDRTRRLETDRSAVRIMTIHRAKGLEFPIVLVPEASELRAQKSTSTPPAIAFQQEVSEHASERLLDVNVGRLHRERAHQAAAEARDEELRTFYVACTRARSHLVCWWTEHEEYTPHAPLHRLLCGDHEPGMTPPGAVPSHRRPLRVAAEAAHRFEAVSIVPATPPLVMPRDRDPGAAPLLATRPFHRVIDTRWRRTSYSALTAEAHLSAGDPRIGTTDTEPLGLAEPGGGPGSGHVGLDDEPTELELTAALVPAATAADVPDAEPRPLTVHPSPRVDLDIDSELATLPGGTDFGTLVHAVLEGVSTDSRDLGTSIHSCTAEWLDQLPLPGIDRERLARGLEQVMSTPLTGLLEGPDGTRCLADIADQDRLNEFGFELDLSQVSHSANTLADVALALQTPALTGNDEFAARYGAHLADSPVAEKSLAGFLTGSIDAVLRQRANVSPADQPHPPREGAPADASTDRFHVIDYKTNRLMLPPDEVLTAGHYLRQPMAEAMIAAHYPLQALLYCVALHRHLRWRLPGYQPGQHLGGVGYLFVRGMAGPTTPVVEQTRCGVFTWWPDPRLVLATSRILGGGQ